MPDQYYETANGEKIYYTDNQIKESVLSAQIRADDTAASYEELFSKIRLQTITSNNLKTAALKAMNDALSARSDLVEMFKSKAIEMYPQLAGDDIFEIAYQVSPNHPLADLLSQYTPKFEEYDRSIAKYFGDYSAAFYDEQASLSEEAATVDSYQTTVGPVTSKSLDLIMARLPKVEEVHTMEEEQSIVGDVSALKMVDPEARAFVERQLANQSISSSNLTSPEEKVSDIHNDQSVIAPKPIPKVAWWAGGAFLVYLLFGGNS